ncbi:60S ribosomal protein L28 [Xylographa pallens]|nr:60S ribosomal protein L28 [Xylographa pallens]
MALLPATNASATQWYVSDADDVLYAIALDACHGTSARLTAKLLRDDRQLFDNGKSYAAVETFIRNMERKIHETEGATSKLSKNMGKVANTFCGFAVRMSELVAPLVPQSPEYAVPYGILIIIFKAVVTKSEKQKEVLDYFDQFHQSTIYADVLTLLEHAASYYALGRLGTVAYIGAISTVISSNRVLGKLADAMFPRSKYEFSKEFAKLTFLTKRLHDLAERSHFAEQQSVKDTVEGTGAVIAGMYQIMNAAVGNMTDLSREVDEIRAFSSKWNKVQAVQTSSSLQNALIHNIESISDEMHLWQDVNFRLSPKDRWEANSILLYLTFWTRLSANSILWISAPTSNRDTWVTDFSLDVIRTSLAQDVLLSFVLCDRPSGASYTDTQLVKRLICRIIEKQPTLVVESPELFDERLFQRAEIFEQVWRVFGRIVATVEPLFIIIDRLDLCQMKFRSDEGETLLTRLSELVERNSKSLKIIVTSAEPDPPPSNLAISFCKIETHTRPSRRPIKYQALESPNSSASNRSSYFDEQILRPSELSSLGSAPPPPVSVTDSSSSSYRSTTPHPEFRNSHSEISPQPYRNPPQSSTSITNMPSRLSKTRKHRGHVSAGHGRVGKHRKHPGGRGMAGGQHHHRTNIDKYHPGYFGKVGMRYFHKLQNQFWKPVINLDKLWSLITPEKRDEYLKNKEGDVAPVLDLLPLGYSKVLGKGRLPEIPMVVRARYFSKEAERKIKDAGGIVELVA